MTIDVVFRNEKGDELTWEEMDANLANLKVAIETKKDNFSILPVAQGGTGVATIAEAKQVLEVPEFANQIEYMPDGVGAVATSVQDQLRSLELPDYSALRSFNGNMAHVRIVKAGITGEFIYDSSDTTSADDGGTVLVDALGRRWKRDYSGSVSVLWFGAVPDWNGVTGTDNKAAIQNAATYCENSGDFLAGAAGSFYVSDTVILKCNGDLSQMQIYAPGATATGPIIRVGRTDASATQSLNLTLPKVRNISQMGNDWAGAGSYQGIELANVYYSKITVDDISGFAVGLDCGGYAHGFGINTVMFSGSVQDNTVGLRLKPKSANGWANDNVFIGAGVRVNSNFGSEVAGVRNIQLAPYDVTVTTTGWPNNNVFVKPCVEGNAPEFHIEISGSDNQFISPRLETTGGVNPKIRQTGHASVNVTARNSILGGFNASSFVFSSSGLVSGTLFQSPSRNALDSIAPAYPLLALVNNSSSSNPILRSYPAGKKAIDALTADTDWTLDISSAVTSYKATGATYPSLTINHGLGTLSFGDGTIAPAKTITGSSSGLRVGADWWPSTDNARSLGFTSLRWTFVHAFNVRTHGVTVSALPTAAGSGAGTRAFVTDANATTFASVVAGGGANGVPVYSDGTNWRIG